MLSFSRPHRLSPSPHTAALHPNRTSRQCIWSPDGVPVRSRSLLHTGGPAHLTVKTVQTARKLRFQPAGSYAVETWVARCLRCLFTRTKLSRQACRAQTATVDEWYPSSRRPNSAGTTTEQTQATNSGQPVTSITLVKHATDHHRSCSTHIPVGNPGEILNSRSFAKRSTYLSRLNSANRASDGFGRKARGGESPSRVSPRVQLPRLCGSYPRRSGHLKE